MTERPKINMKSDWGDKTMELVSLFLVLIIILIPVWYYDSLPTNIPTHFGLSGEADVFMDKISIWILPVVVTAIYIGLWFLSRNPHVLNYPQKITSENVDYQYHLGSKFIRSLNLLILLGLCYLEWAIVQTAFGYQKGLSVFYLPVFLVVVIGVCAVYLYLAFRKKT